jgi:hypothetical protein
MKSINPNPIQVLAEHACSTLPDSINGRKRVLRALQKVLPEKHPAMANIRAQLASLEAVERLQISFDLKGDGHQ